MIQDWAALHFGDQIGEGFGEVLGNRRDVVLGDADVELIGTWVISDRELPGGGTIALRYSERDDISAVEREIAQRIATARLTMLSVDQHVPGRSITAFDATTQEQVVVLSHDVSRYVVAGDLLVARVMAGPPAPSLWGPAAFLDRGTGRDVRDLLSAQIESLGLPDEPASLGVAMRLCAREITRLLLPSLRDAVEANKLAA